MNAKSCKHRKRVFLSFLISYIIVLLLPVIISSMVYREALKIVEDDAKQNTLSLLRQSRDVLDRRLSEIDSMVMQMSLNSKLKELLYLEGQVEGADVYKVKEAWDEMSSYIITNNFIDTFHIYFKHSKMVLSPQMPYIRLPFFYGHCFKYGDMEDTDWYEKTLNRYYYKQYFPAESIIMNGASRSMVTFIQSIPVESFSDIRANVLVFIDEEEIHKLLSQLKLLDNGWFYIMDKDGKLITGISNGYSGSEFVDGEALNLNEGFLERPVSGKDMIISYTTSSYNGWKYIAGISSHVVMEKVEYIKKIALGLTSIVLLLGLMASFLLAYRNSKPIRDMIKKLIGFIGNNTDIEGNEYDFLQGNISKLIDNNKMLQNTIQQQVPILKAVFMERLLKGEFSNEKELEAFLAHTGINFRGDRYVIVIIHFCGYRGMITSGILKELDVQKAIVQNLLENILMEKVHLHNAGDDKTALLLSMESVESKSYEAFIKGVVNRIDCEFHSKYNSNLFFSVGDVCQSLIDVYQSFNEAKQGLVYETFNKDNGIIWYKQLSGESESFYYPSEIETRLINMVKAGDSDGVRNIFDMITRENFSKRRLAPDMAIQVFYELRGTIFKVLEQITITSSDVPHDVKARVKEVKPEENMAESLNCLQGSILSICRVIDEQKKSHNRKLIDDITSYIDANYNNPDLCLSSIGGKFRLTDVYLSQFFKEQTGENFVNYVEEIRIRHAREILIKKELSMSEIAASVGYNSADTFRKAFKRVYGMSPTNYRGLARQ